MRSELVFDAMAYVSDRFLLSRLVSKATRRFHKSNTRIQDTTNDVFVSLSRVLCAAQAENSLCASKVSTHSYWRRVSVSERSYQMQSICCTD